MAGASRVSTSDSSIGMTISTNITAEVLAVLLDRRSEIHNTQARLTSTFQLSYCYHHNLLIADYLSRCS